MNSPTKLADFEQHIELLMNPAALASISTAELLLLVGRASNDFIDQALAAEEDQKWHEAAVLYMQLKRGLENAAAFLPNELKKQLLASTKEWDKRVQKLQQQAKLKAILTDTKDTNKNQQLQQVPKPGKRVVVISTQPAPSSAQSRIFKRNAPTLRETMATKNSKLRNSVSRAFDIRKKQEWREDKQ